MAETIQFPNLRGGMMDYKEEAKRIAEAHSLDDAAMKSISWSITIAVRKAVRDERLRQVMNVLRNAKVASFSNGEFVYYVHPSSRHQGMYQLSRTDKLGPMGHSDYNSFEEAVASVIGCGRDPIGNDRFLLVDWR